MRQTLKEAYADPITVGYPEWVDFVASGRNLQLGEAVRLGPSMVGSAVQPGHVRQNYMTAGLCPYCQFTLAPEAKNEIGW